MVHRKKYATPRNAVRTSRWPVILPVFGFRFSPFRVPGLGPTPEEAGLQEEKSHGGADDEDEDESDDRRSAVVTFEDGMDYDRGTEIIRADTGSERQLEGAGENPLLQGRGEK